MHAYKRYSANYTDSLIVYVSTNCGQAFQRVLSLGENGTGSFATGYISQSAFTPSTANDWCNGPVGASCQTIDLTSFVGHSNVLVKFESYNNHGNNLYIDNININGTLISTPPTVQFTASTTSICQGQSVTFTDQSYPAVTSRQWTFHGGNPQTSTNQTQTVIYNISGSWDVTLSATNAAGTSQQTFTNYINVHSLPEQRDIIQNGSILSVQLFLGETVQWYRNGNAITGAISPTYVVTQLGNYKAKITNQNGCFIFTNELYVNPTAVEDYVLENNNIRIFLNPANDYLYVSFSKPFSQKSFIVITDITGKTISEHSIEEGIDKLKINTSNLPDGLYVIRLFADVFVHPLRFMKLKF